MLSVQTVLPIRLPGVSVMQQEQQFLDELMTGLDQVLGILNAVKHETERQIDDVLDNALIIAIVKMERLQKKVNERRE
jgi:hypothetical protein